jgi:hypothetical protein
MISQKFTEEFVSGNQPEVSNRGPECTHDTQQDTEMTNNLVYRLQMDCPAKYVPNLEADRGKEPMCVCQGREDYIGILIAEMKLKDEQIAFAAKKIHALEIQCENFAQWIKEKNETEEKKKEKVNILEEHNVEKSYQKSQKDLDVTNKKSLDNSVSNNKSSGIYKKARARLESQNWFTKENKDQNNNIIVTDLEKASAKKFKKARWQQTTPNIAKGEERIYNKEENSMPPIVMKRDIETSQKAKPINEKDLVLKHLLEERQKRDALIELLCKPRAEPLKAAPTKSSINMPPVKNKAFKKKEYSVNQLIDLAAGKKVFETTKYKLVKIINCQRLDKIAINGFIQKVLKIGRYFYGGLTFCKNLNCYLIYINEKKLTELKGSNYLSTMNIEEVLQNQEEIIKTAKYIIEEMKSENKPLRLAASLIIKYLMNSSSNEIEEQILNVLCSNQSLELMDVEESIACNGQMPTIPYNNQLSNPTDVAQTLPCPEDKPLGMLV